MVQQQGKRAVYDYIIVGGGSAGSVMANRLSARANKVLLCEAGQDTPPGKEPPEIADSYSGTAYFDPRFHWTELKVHTQVVSHNNPQENRPPLRKYEQARVLGGGSSINGQMANRGAPTDYAEWASARRRRLGLGRGPALLQEGRARPRLRRTAARQGRPHPRAPHPARALDAATPRPSARPSRPGLQVPARPERRVRRRLFPGHPFQRRRAARLGGDGLSRRRDPQAAQPHHLDRHAGQVAAVRGHALRRRDGHDRRQGAGVPRPRGHPLLRRHPFAGPSDARRHRPGRPSRATLGIPVVVGPARASASG